MDTDCLRECIRRYCTERYWSSVYNTATSVLDCNYSHIPNRELVSAVNMNLNHSEENEYTLYRLQTLAGVQLRARGAAHAVGETLKDSSNASRGLWCCARRKQMFRRETRHFNCTVHSTEHCILSESSRQSSTTLVRFAIA